MKSVNTLGQRYIGFLTFWDFFSIFGMLVLLPLFLTGKLNFSDKDTYAYWGLFLTSSYLLPYFGGIIADNYLGKTNAILAGGYTSAFGALIMTIGTTPNRFCFGVSVFLIGNGLLKANLYSLFGELNRRIEVVQHAKFSSLFIWMTVGGLCGPSLYGLLVKYVSWHAGYGVSAVGIFIATWVFQVKNKRHAFEGHSPLLKRSTVCWLVVVCLAMVGIIDLLTYYMRTGDVLMGLASLLVFMFLARRAYQCDPAGKKRVIALLVLLAVTTIFYSASFQSQGILSLFIRDYIHHSIEHWVVPVPMFGSLQVGFAAVWACFFVWFWRRMAKSNRDISICYKLAISMLVSAVSYGLFALMGSIHQLMLLPLWLLLLADVILGFSDALEIPAMFSIISQHAPESLSSRLTSLVFVRSALAGYIASWLSDLSINPKTGHSDLAGFIKVFMGDAVICLVTAVILLLLVRYIRSQLRPS